MVRFSEIAAMPAARTKRATKQAVVSQFRRTEILEAARRVFGRRGFEATHVDHIAADAGIAKGTVYLYFASKVEIFESALMEDLQALREKRWERMQRETTFEGKLRCYVRTTLEECESRRDFLRSVVMEAGRPTVCGSSLPRAADRFIAKEFEQMVGLVSEAMARKEIKSLPPETTTGILVAGMKELIHRRLAETSSRSPAEDVELLMEIVWNGIKR
jgi:AcrR family transcriptional regulator